jgi:hypothetical protein
MADTYPNGYGKQLLTMEDLRTRHGPQMHPEYARRLFACLADAHGLVGIGGGWRSTKMQADSYARAPNTFAPPGLSFHESHRWASGSESYAAVDTVGRDGRHDSAWNWMRDNAGRFGLKTFWNVNGEPWHVQFSDLPNGVSSWKAAGCPDPAQFALPGGGASSTSVPMSMSSATSVSSNTSADSGTRYGAHRANDDKPVLQIGWHGDLVRYVQLVISNEAGGRITVDGDFGPKTEGRVKDVQFFFELAPTGMVDWNGTWQIIDHLAGHERPSAPERDGPVSDVDRGYYWVQRGDSPWAIAERVYGSGTEHTRLDPCEPAEPGFSAADHPIRLPGIAGRTTTVLPGEGALSVIRRLAPGRQPASLVERFQALNGGAHRTLRPGDVVFLDDPSRTGQPN